MKKTSIIVLGGMCLIPAVVLSSCKDKAKSDSPTEAAAPKVETTMDKFIKSNELLVDFGNICKDTADGKITPAEGVEKINKLKGEFTKVQGEVMAIMKDDAQREALMKELQEFEKTEKGAALKKASDDAGDHVANAMLKVKDEAFLKALENFSE